MSDLEAYEPEDILEPFFSFDEDSELYSICLISPLDQRVLTLRLDEDSILSFHGKMADFIEGRLLAEQAALDRRKRRAPEEEG